MYNLWHPHPLWIWSSGALYVLFLKWRRVWKIFKRYGTVTKSVYVIFHYDYWPCRRASIIHEWKFSGLFLNSEFEADFPQKVSLKIVNKGDNNSFSDLFSVCLKTIDHLNLKLWLQSNLGYPNVDYPKLLGYSKTTDSPDFFLYYLLQ